MGDAPRSYSDDEVEAILRRALERQAAEVDGHGHDELVAAAREVGLDEGAIERAVAEIRAEGELEAIRVARTRRKRAAWARHLAVYLIVVGALLGLHALGVIGAFAIAVAVAWGSGLALHGLAAARGATEREVTREKSRRDQRARRAAEDRARWEAAQREAEAQAARTAAGPALEQVVEEGVALLLTAAAKKLREASARLDAPAKEAAPAGEFAEYVARQRGAHPAATEVAAPTRDASRAKVRVPTSPDEPPPHEVERAPSRRRARSRAER